MTAPRFIQIHWLASYPATLLNRDQDGLGKRIPFGGEVRGRISSQCLKRHWRFAGSEGREGARQNPWALQNLRGLSDADFGIRSRKLMSSELVGPLIAEGLDAKTVEEWRQALMSRVFPKKGSKESGSGNSAPEVDAEEDDDVTDDTGTVAEDTKQAFLLGPCEIKYLRDLLRQAVKGDAEVQAAIRAKPKAKGLSPLQKKLAGDLRDNLEALGEDARVPRSLEAALFGRMVTSDLIANVDAAIHVAHAITVHPIAREMDFMSVVDDLKNEDDSADAGAAGVFDMELTSGLYYGYTVVDVALLRSNLGGDAALAGKVVEHLLHLIAEVSPGAKKGSTAPYAYADLMLVEAGSRQPRTLANAFRKSIRSRTNRQFDETVEALRAHLDSLDATYGGGEQRRLLALDADAALPGAERNSLDEMAAWAGARVAA